jgi:hypothetical protein
MAAFDVTTKPTVLNLKPGTTGSIMVVVSNRLGRPIMGLVEGVLTPASAAKWVVSPPELQRRYEADPAATVNYEFKVAVPKDAPDQTAQFKASVRDVLAPDDSRVEGQTVAVNVTRDKIEPPVKRKMPWWPFAVAGLVLVGVGLGLYFGLRPKGVPDVVGKPPAEASEILTGVGFDSIAVTDTLGDQSEDTNRVIRQDPVAKSEIPPKDSMTKAILVVNRQSATVPPLVGQPLSFAIDRLNQAGLRAGNLSGQYTGKVSEADRIVSTTPGAGTALARGSAVNLLIHKYSETPPPTCPDLRRCPIGIDPKWTVQIQKQPSYKAPTMIR